MVNYGKKTMACEKDHGMVKIPWYGKNTMVW